MQLVDHEGMPVPEAVRPGHERLVLSCAMRVLRWEASMVVLDLLRVIPRPQRRRRTEPCHRQHGQHQESGPEPDRRAKAASERIGEQPAGMAQRELRGE